MTLLKNIYYKRKDKSMEQEIREMRDRAYQSWETDFMDRLMKSNKLIRVASATFTMKKAKHRVPNTTLSFALRYGDGTFA